MAHDGQAQNRRRRSPSPPEAFVRRVRRRLSHKSFAETGGAGGEGSAADEHEGSEPGKRRGNIGGAIVEGARRVKRAVRSLRPSSR